jgi:hypothetical protein
MDFPRLTIPYLNIGTLVSKHLEIESPTIYCAVICSAKYICSMRSWWVQVAVVDNLSVQIQFGTHAFDRRAALCEAENKERLCKLYASPVFATNPAILKTPLTMN